MFIPDFSDKTYIAEVIKCRADGEGALKRISKLAVETQVKSQDGESADSAVTVCHGFVASKDPFHRFPRTVTNEAGEKISIPRRKTVRGQEYSLYDVFVACRRRYVIVAVPFHDLAEDFFVEVDGALGGTGTSYQKLDITALVVELGASGVARLKSPHSDKEVGLSVTRCHLSYVDQEHRTANLQQLSMTGANLGESKEYRLLVDPVLNPKKTSLAVIPVVLGFALSVNGVRKSSATTDRHGNFKIWIAPGLRRLIRLFDMLDALEEMKEIAQTTNNIPILQSRTIREAEE